MVPELWDSASLSLLQDLTSKPQENIRKSTIIILAKTLGSWHTEWSQKCGRVRVNQSWRPELSLCHISSQLSEFIAVQLKLRCIHGRGWKCSWNTWPPPPPPSPFSETYTDLRFSLYNNKLSSIGFFLGGCSITSLIKLKLTLNAPCFTATAKCFRSTMLICTGRKLRSYTFLSLSIFHGEKSAFFYSYVGMRAGVTRRCHAPVSRAGVTRRCHAPVSCCI